MGNPSIAFSPRNQIAGLEVGLVVESLLDPVHPHSRRIFSARPPCHCWAEPRVGNMWGGQNINSTPVKLGLGDSSSFEGTQTRGLQQCHSHVWTGWEEDSLCVALAFLSFSVKSFNTSCNQKSRSEPSLAFVAQESCSATSPLQGARLGDLKDKASGHLPRVERFGWFVGLSGRWVTWPQRKLCSMWREWGWVSWVPSPAPRERSLVRCVFSVLKLGFDCFGHHQ